ncbi:hypothetical protein RHGRI_004566 [Rhododendron griersonianum]|uniref:ATP-dependent DNA helicase n=1 Tax=Rhododendron griersonianum TaxID=479676 RepID=A0AAV6L9H0_9ERIC|nr:hypothetical protein RHGRI_004566 [Rhododendron griersonianum]
MSQNKRIRKPYCELSQEEKNRINARRRTLYAERRSQRENTLLPVQIREQVSAEENVESSLASSYIQDNASNELERLDEDNAHPVHFISAGSTSRLHDQLHASIPVEISRQQSIPTEAFRLPHIEDCRHCGAKRFPYETPKFCCSGGEVSLYPIAIPPNLRQLYSGSGPDSAHFLQYIKPYNEILAFTSIGVHLDPVFAKRLNGIYTFRAQGQIYHFIDGLYPSGQMPSYLQLYFYDTEKEAELRRGDKDKLHPEIISSLIHLLEGNPYSQFFRGLTHLPNIEEYQIVLKADPKVADYTALPPTVPQVAAIWLENEEAPELQERDIIVHKHDGHSQTISYYFGCYDPLQYPLLFPLGEPGWHQGIKKIKRTSASRSCLAQRSVLPMHSSTPEELITNETTVHQENAKKANMVSAQEFYAYRLQIRKNTNEILLESARLLQQFTVDMYVKIETSRYFYRRTKGHAEAILECHDFSGEGHDKIIYRLMTSKFPQDVDEIQQFQAARWISPPEAVWRIYQFPLHEIRPAVITLQLHLEGCQLIPLKKDANLHSIVDNEFTSRTMLTQFFWMNAHNEKAKSLQLLYKNFPEHFVWTASSRTWTERKQQEVIGQIVTANPTEGERYYLRLLLTHIPAPTSYAHLRTANGIAFSSYREAAISHGLLQDDNSNEKCMEEACLYQMPLSLRQLFCTILVYCAPINPLELFYKFEDDMTEDYISIQKFTRDRARQVLLQALNAELESMGKNLYDFQLSHLLTSDSTTRVIPKEVQDEMNLSISEDYLRSPALLNPEQAIAYDEILDAVLNRKAKSFFIDGPGGTGKTFLYRALLAQVRSQHVIALATASSGVAASILPNGRTAHSRFKIPINADGKLCCSISKQSGLAALIKQAILIIWDEASMAKKETIEALDWLLRDLTENDILFGGKLSS